MTLDEAIQHCEEVAEQKQIQADELSDIYSEQECLECASEHRQLAEWLRELKTIKENSKDLSQMMFEIYMEGVNMTGEYQGCWVRFKDIEKIIKKYATKEVNADEE